MVTETRWLLDCYAMCSNCYVYVIWCGSCRCIQGLACIRIQPPCFKPAQTCHLAGWKASAIKVLKPMYIYEFKKPKQTRAVFAREATGCASPCCGAASRKVHCVPDDRLQSLLFSILHVAVDVKQYLKSKALHSGKWVG